MHKIDNSNRRSLNQLRRFLQQNRRLTVLSGAGCSTDSGIPDYRDDDGNWKHARPVQFADFLYDEATRRRYWARSFIGWTRIARARPNGAHEALARLERAGRVECLITQNVDNLHRIAGSNNVIDLHGVLHRVRCLACDAVSPREHLQERLRTANPDFTAVSGGFAPDGDARLELHAVNDFVVPACERCGGILKPDVVFFGEAVPELRVQRARRHLAGSDALLVVGSSLMVWSGYRFARLAVDNGKALAIVNRGVTRADGIAACRVRGGCTEVLCTVLDELLHGTAG